MDTKNKSIQKKNSINFLAKSIFIDGMNKSNYMCGYRMCAIERHQITNGITMKDEDDDGIEIQNDKILFINLQQSFYICI